MAFWDVDLTTRSGAETATSQGALACFIIAGLTVLAAVFFGGVIGFDTLDGQIAIGVIALQAVIALVAGLRFRAGKSAFWGIAVVAMLVLEIINKLVTLTGIGGLVINAIMLVVVVQGVRGAWALKSGAGFEDDHVGVFE